VKSQHQAIKYVHKERQYKYNPLEWYFFRQLKFKFYKIPAVLAKPDNSPDCTLRQYLLNTAVKGSLLIE
jgi:hypothetical protein